jgi:hypothetical protein
MPTRYHEASMLPFLGTQRLYLPSTSKPSTRWIARHVCTPDGWQVPGMLVNSSSYSLHCIPRFRNRLKRYMSQDVDPCLPSQPGSAAGSDGWQGTRRGTGSRKSQHSRCAGMMPQVLVFVRLSAVSSAIATAGTLHLPFVLSLCSAPVPSLTHFCVCRCCAARPASCRPRARGSSKQQRV